MAKDRVYEFSAPGRVEIGGNHTDHQHGRVLAAAIDLTTNASVCKNDDEVIRVFSQGYDPVEVYIHDLELHEAEKNTTVALVRGVSAAFVQRGCPIGGFDARISSTVLPGSGLSSSAAFEVLMGRIINGLYFENRLSPVEIAQIGQYAENVYFGKPCGVFGKEYLRDVDEAEFYRRLPEVRAAAGDRAVLRAMHIFDDNRRVTEQTEALRSERFDSFLRLVNKSGESSWKYLQNVIPSGSSEHQEMAFAIALCKKLLNGRGAVRVHGGGFAGTVLAFVPNDKFDAFKAQLEGILGSGCCHRLRITG